jgi:hypothetical protein
MLIYVTDAACLRFCLLLLPVAQIKDSDSVGRMMPVSFKSTMKALAAIILTAAGMTDLRRAFSSQYLHARAARNVQANLTQIGGPDCSKIKDCHKRGDCYYDQCTLACHLKGMRGQGRRPTLPRYSAL